MTTFIHHYSFLITAVAVFAAAFALLCDGVTRRDMLALAIIAGSFFFSWLVLRLGPSTLRQPSEVDGAPRSGQPTLIEFQSEY